MLHRYRLLIIFIICSVVIGGLITVIFLKGNNQMTGDNNIETNLSEPLDTNTQELDLAEDNGPIIDNLVAFAKLYGYIKYFHPSDEASQLDWDLFAIHGVERVLEAQSEHELMQILKDLFLPIAPTMQIYTTTEEIEEIILQEVPDTQKIAWQHFGVGLKGNNNSIYKSSRVLHNGRVNMYFEAFDFETGEVDLEHHWLQDPRDEEINVYKLFEDFPEKHNLVKQLHPHIHILLPIVVSANDNGTIGATENTIDEYSQLLKKLAERNKNIPSYNNKNVRIATIIDTWNVFQHFYPYFDVVKVEWEEKLREALNDSFVDMNAEDFLNVLRIMLAYLEDGHIDIYPSSMRINQTNLPFIIDWIEDSAVVTVTADEELVKVGDIILSVDGMEIEEYLNYKEQYISGSPHYKRRSMMKNIVIGRPGQIKSFEIARESNILNVRAQYPAVATDSIDFYNRKASVLNLEESIYYLNLASLTVHTFEQHMNDLAFANGIIVDLRTYPDEIGIRLIEHLITKPVETPVFNIMTTIYPDQEQLMYYRGQGWTINPRSPTFSGKIVFLIDSEAISYAETLASIIKHFGIGVLVGQPTAGANGDVNPIKIFGDYVVWWTGLQVLNHDGSQFHNIGVLPDIYVERTIEAVKEGRDEYIETALEVIRQALNN